jgi:hypothetical protein
MGYMIKMESMPKGMMQKGQQCYARNISITSKALGMDTLAKRTFGRTRTGRCYPV